MKYLRITALVILLIGILIIGYLRERYLLIFSSETVFTLVKKYPRISATNFNNEVHSFWSMDLSPKLLSSILYSLVFAALTSIIVYLVTKKKVLGYLMLALYGIYFVVCFLLIEIGNLGVNYHLSYGLSHNIEDLFLSPFIIMMIFPSLYFLKKGKTI